MKGKTRSKASNMITIRWASTAEFLFFHVRHCDGGNEYGNLPNWAKVLMAQVATFELPTVGLVGAGQTEQHLVEFGLIAGILVTLSLSPLKSPFKLVELEVSIDHL